MSDALMLDALMLTAIVAFFALCVAYVSWCDRIIGPDPFEADDEIGTHDEATRVAADGPEEVPV